MGGVMGVRLQSIPSWVWWALVGVAAALVVSTLFDNLVLALASILATGGAYVKTRRSAKTIDRVAEEAREDMARQRQPDPVEDVREDLADTSLADALARANAEMGRRDDT